MHSGAASKRGATHRHGYWSHEEDDEHRRGTSEGRTSASVGEKTTTRMSGMPGLGAPAAQGPPRGRPRMMDALPKWTPRKSTFETGVFEILSQRGFVRHGNVAGWFETARSRSQKSLLPASSLEGHDFPWPLRRR